MNARILVISFLTLATLQGAGPSAFAIRDARVVRVSGPTVEHSTVIVRDGLIDAVGENLSVPAGAWVIEGKGLTVYPGLTDALSTWGIPEAAPAMPGAQGRGGAPPAAPASPPAAVARGPEDRPSNTSWIPAPDLLSLSDKRIETARS